MSRRILSAHRIFLLFGLGALLCIGAEPAEIETIRTVTPENIASINKDGSAMFEVKLRFPQISLGHVQTQTIQVRQPKPNSGNIPTFLVIEVPYKEAAARTDARWQPWQGAKCRIQMKTLEGTVFYDQTLDVTRDWNGSHWGLITEEDRGGTIQILPSFPKAKEAGLYERSLADYDIIIHVQTPSRRPTDSFQFPEQLIGFKSRAQ